MRLNLNNVASTEFDDNQLLLDNPELAEILRSKRRNVPLGIREVMKLVKTLELGRARHANIEKYRDQWRLRFSMRDGKGGYTRKGIVIADSDAKSQVEHYLREARLARGKFKYELFERKFERINREYRLANARSAKMEEDSSCGHFQ